MFIAIEAIVSSMKIKSNVADHIGCPMNKTVVECCKLLLKRVPKYYTISIASPGHPPTSLARYAQGKRHSRYKGVEAVAAGFVSRR
jgi:hypothetical protein